MPAMTEEQTRLFSDEELHRSTAFIQLCYRDGQLILTQFISTLTKEQQLEMFKYLANHCGYNILHLISGE